MGRTWRTRAPLLVAVALSGLGCNSILGINPAVSDDGGGGGNYSVDCDNYCTLVQQACNGDILANGDNTEYLSKDVCLKICPQIPETDAGISPSIDPTGDDSLNCRVWHANAALQSNPHYHCPHAGPLGGGICNGNDDPCRSFCNLDLFFCQGTNQQYASVQDCMNACEPDAGYQGFPYELDEDNNEVTDLANYAASNTLNCRMYHLENFLFTGLPVHCTHTSASGGGTCVGTPQVTSDSGGDY